MAGFDNALGILQNFEQLPANFNSQLISVGDQPLSDFVNLPIQRSVGDNRHIFSSRAQGLRQFTFVFYNGLSLDGPVTNVVRLNVNPEDYRMEIPYRSNAFQTLGGIFVDIWGVGVKRLVIRGHTGWKVYHDAGPNGAAQDGFDNIMSFRDDIINAYFQAREDNKEKSENELEKQVRITLIDKLHLETFSLVPEAFRLMRHRSRPLLHMYEVSFIILNEQNFNPDPLAEPLLNDQNPIAKVNGGLSSLINKLGDVFGLGLGNDPYAQAIKGVAQVHHDLAGGLRNLLQTKNSIDQTVISFSNLAMRTSQALTTMMSGIWAFTDLSGIAAELKLAWQSVKQMGSDFQCLLHHITSFGLDTYTGMVGTTGCGVMYGLPQSALDSLSGNSFETLLSSLNSRNNASITRSVTNSGQARISNAIATDLPLLMINQ